MKILLVGSGAREHALGRSLANSPQKPDLACFATNLNPGLRELALAFTTGSLADLEAIMDFALGEAVELAVIGPEAPLEAGLADRFWEQGIPCVGPRRQLAQVETSKTFTRELLTRHQIPACPRYRSFTGLEGVPEFLAELGDHYVVKYDGLRGGKGVKVSGDHLHSHEEALAYCQHLAAAGDRFLIEEKCHGQEFSLMSFCDGRNLVHMPAVQDHKRAFVGDRGPNTGGMGSYSAADHSLPFLEAADLHQAQVFNQTTAAALQEEFGQGYQGILYGGFMATAEGVKLIEYNARFGDPEALNVLALLESDFATICQAIVEGTLHASQVSFAPQATVCKYAVPEGYPDQPLKGRPIDVSAVEDPEQLYFASVEAHGEGLYQVGSRAVACVGIATTLEAAEQKAEADIRRVTGPLFHREDIGTQDLIQRRIDHMKRLRAGKRVGSPEPAA